MSASLTVSEIFSVKE